MGLVTFKRERALVNKDYFMKESQVYILSKFHSEFPQYSSFKYEELTKLVSRSSQISEWFSSVKEEFRLLDETPQWFIDSGGAASEWSKRYSDVVKVINQERKAYASKVLKVSTEYRETCLKLRSEFDKKFSSLAIDPIIDISNITFAQLPLDIIIKSMDLSTEPQVPGDMSPQSKYQAEQLESFRVVLCKAYMKDPKSFKLEDHIYVAK